MRGRWGVAAFGAYVRRCVSDRSAKLGTAFSGDPSVRSERKNAFLASGHAIGSPIFGVDETHARLQSALAVFGVC